MKNVFVFALGSLFASLIVPQTPAALAVVCGSLVVAAVARGFMFLGRLLCEPTNDE